MANRRSKLIPLTGTERRPLPGARAIGEVDAQERVSVTVLVRSRKPLSSRQSTLRNALATPIATRKYLSREELAALHGANPSDLDAIERFAHRHELTVMQRSQAERRVVLAGTLGALTGAFGVRLKRVVWQGKEHRVRSGPVRVPLELADLIEDVKGFDDRPQALPHFRRLVRLSSSAKDRRARHPLVGATTSFTPPQIAKLYDFPVGVDGSGQCIGLIELGGGYRTTDLDAYFKSLNQPAPTVIALGIDGGANTPGSEADGEVMLDIEVVATIAPQAKVVVYFAPNTDQGFVDAIKTAVHDTAHQPSVISISWGGPEETYTAQSLENYDDVFAEAAALGVTILVASGDNGSADVNPPDKQKRVDFPAASPLVLSCGGTRLEVDASGTAISAETVWNDGAQGGASGGGVSTKYPLPVWQKTAQVPTLNGQPGRGVPDVAGNADPQSGYQVRVDGENEVIGGTSAVAPLWAGLVALFNQQLGKPVGFLNSSLYTPVASAALRDVTVGNNVGYAAAAGWDACTGLGSPNGAKLFAVLQTSLTGAEKRRKPTR